MRATTQVIATDRFYDQLHNYCKMQCLFCKFTILCPHYEIDNGSSYDNIRFDEIKVTNNNK